MCSEFTIRTTPAQVERALGVPTGNRSGKESWNSTIKFSNASPTIDFHAGHSQLMLSERIFPVSPFPNSRLSGFERQTDGNADSHAQPAQEDSKSPSEDPQIKRIYSMPRWGKPFATKPCLVPMSSFTEYAYWGDEAGSALMFEMPDQDLFFAAGIVITPFVPKTGQDDAFSILTHTATEQMLRYHQRLIVILKAEDAAEYLSEMTAEARFNFLIQSRYTGEFKVSTMRKMAKGWEKRISVQQSKLARESEYRAAIKAEGVDG